MSYDRAAIGRLRELCLKDGGWHYVAHVITECLDEIDRQARETRILRKALEAIERLTRGAQGEGNHRLLVQIREAVREALAETEGP